MVSFDLDKLQERYQKELRPDLGNPEREDLTLKLWIEILRKSARLAEMPDKGPWHADNLTNESKRQSNEVSKIESKQAR